MGAVEEQQQRHTLIHIAAALPIPTITSLSFTVGIMEVTQLLLILQDPVRLIFTWGSGSGGALCPSAHTVPAKRNMVSSPFWSPHSAPTPHLLRLGALGK